MPLTAWARAYYSVGMKTWVVLAAAMLPIGTGAWAVTGVRGPVDEASRIQAIGQIEASRAALLPQTQPPPQVTLRYQPRLDQIKGAVSAARTAEELAKARKDFDDWKQALLRELYSDRGPAPGTSFPAFSAARNGEIDFVLAVRQQIAAQRTADQLRAATSIVRAAATDSPWTRFFDNAGETGRLVAREADGAVRAPAPLAENDPARYDKVRALLLSQGVSPQIVDIAIAEGRRQKVDPMIVLSVIDQESRFRRGAHNKGSGCVGLMQLAPDTAADMGARGNLFDPRTNIRAGVKYLEWIANSFFKMNLDMSNLSRIPEEKLKVVLAAYNWGIGNVRRVVRRYGPPALERVAPKETRDYIAEIPQRISAWFASF